MARNQNIWVSLVAFGGYSYSAYSDGETVSIRRGENRKVGHREILQLPVRAWEELLDQNGQPSFGEIEELAYNWNQ